MVDVEASFWKFSLRVYEASGVAEACLWLQDHRQLDVNLLLFCLWSGRGRGVVEVDLMAEAGALAEEWSTRVVRPLRTARRGLASTVHEELREQVQRAELAAERIEQERLQRLVRDLPPVELSPAAAHAAARCNLEHYLRSARVEIDVEVEARLATVLAADS
jgi:uncharacterized protein (TIGR02444 family)